MSKIVIDENKIKNLTQDDPFMDMILHNEHKNENNKKIENKIKNETFTNKNDCEDFEVYNKLNEINNSINYLVSEMKSLKLKLNKKNTEIEIQIKKQNKILNEILNNINKLNKKKISLFEKFLNFFRKV